ncbi:MAG: hypothetical protein Kow00104_04860 [Rhodothalassiaceae bacterium]
MDSDSDKRPDSDFDERLERARARLGRNDGGREGEKEREALSGGYRLGVEFAAAIAVGAFLGYWLDRWFGSSPILLIGMTCLGVAAGIRTLMRLFATGDGKDGEDRS